MERHGWLLMILVSVPVNSIPDHTAPDFADVGAFRCSRRGLPVQVPMVPPLLVTSTGDSVLAPRMHNPLAASTENISDSMVAMDAWGQAVIIESVRDSSLSLHQGDTVLIIPWAYRADCGRVRWEDTALWMPPGERAIFWAAPRQPSAWVDGTMTFDVWGWQAPYPWGRFLRYERWARGSVADGWLTADELWQLLAHIPSIGDGPYDSVEVLAALDQWAAINPEVARRFPAVSILLYVRERLRGG